MRLTDRGRQYAAEVRVALVALAESTRRVRSTDRDRRLIVSTIPSFSARWLTLRIGNFIVKYSEIDLELLTTGTLIDFNQDDVDVTLRFGYGKYSGLHAERLLDEIFFPACSPDFNGGKLPREPRDLTTLPLLRSDDELWRPWLDAAGLTDFPEPKRGVFLYEDSSNLLQVAINGQDIALVRRSLAMEEILSGRLVRLFNVDGPNPWTYYFVCPPALLDTPRVQAFREWIFAKRSSSGCSTSARTPLWHARRCVMPRRASSEHYLDHRVTGERAIDIVEMRAVLRADRAGQPHVVAARRRTRFHARGVEILVVLFEHIDDRVLKTGIGLAHHLDRKVARKVEQFVGAVLGGVGGIGGLRFGFVGHDVLLHYARRNAHANSRVLARW